MNPRFFNLSLLISFILFSTLARSQDYLINTNGDTLRGYIREFGMKKILLQVNEKKKVKFNIHEIKEFFYEIKSLHYQKRTIINRKENIFLPVPDRTYFLASYSGNNNIIHVTRTDTLTLYRIFVSDQGSMPITYEEGYENRTAYFSSVYIYIESPSYGLAALYEPVMTDLEFEDTFARFKKYFSGKSSVVEKIIHARNGNLRKTYTYSFTNEVLQDYFGKEVMARTR
jgi:hypothetical protein